MAKRTRWTRDQLLVALRVYCCTDFGKLHRRNSEIIQSAALINRTPDALAMKACNFASLDPAQRARGITGLRGRSRADERLWQEFQSNSESIAVEAEAVWERLVASRRRQTDAVAIAPPDGPTEVERSVRTRRVQRFFRNAVLATYENRCALTKLTLTDLLVASHIIPWKESEPRRADPSNGICLNAFHDKAFDRGLITFDEDLRVVVSSVAKLADAPDFHVQTLLRIEGHSLCLPSRFEPDQAALEFHREKVFRDSP